MPQPLKKPLKPLDLGTESFSDRLRRLRRHRGLTQAELADVIGVTREAIAAYEAGRVRLFDEMVARYAIALGVSADELLGITNLPAEETASLRIMRRIKKLEKLPPAKQKAILQTLDMALQSVETDKPGTEDS